MSTHSFELRGRMPLLMHADNIDGADELAAWRSDPKNKKISTPGDDRSPGWTWLTYLYHDGEHVSMPYENVMAALRKAGASFTMKGKSTLKSATQSSLLIETEHLEFLAAGKRIKIHDLVELRDEPFRDMLHEVKKFGFTLSVKRARVGSSKHVRVRPRFDNWAVRGTIEILDPIITGEVLEQLFQHAGTYCGLCDWRPNAKESPGPYGTFNATVKQLSK